jgi:hypothetical protein
LTAYNFKARFIEPIRAGTKRQTIRAERLGRSRHARPGEVLQIYTALRTKRTELLGYATCVRVRSIRFEFSACRNIGESRIYISGGEGMPWRRFCPTSLDAFARRDGFEDWGELREFWALEHDGVREFEGALIEWDGFRQAGLKGEISPAFDAALKRAPRRRHWVNVSGR